MKVKELIEMLSKVDPEMEIVTYEYDSEFGIESYNPINSNYLPTTMKLSENPTGIPGFRYLVKNKKLGFSRKEYFVIR